MKRLFKRLVVFVDRRKLLDDIFKDIDENEKKLIDPLIEEVVFLEEQMTELKKLPFIRVNAKNPELQKKTEASKLASKKVQDIPRTYQYKGENGVRTVYKSPQNARKAYDQARENLVSTAYRDHPSIVKSPKGGYSVVPHGIAKLNNLKEISPYSIDMSDS